MADLHVLRAVPELSDAAVGNLAQQLKRAADQQFKEAQRTNVIEPYRRAIAMRNMLNAGWVDNDIPHDDWVTKEIMEGTPEREGFAIADPDGHILAKYNSLLDAEAARKGAKLDLKVHFEIPTDDKPVKAALSV